MLAAYFRLPRTIHLICVGTLVNRAGALVLPFLTIYLTQKLKLDDAFATRTIGVAGLGAVLGLLAGGQLADRIGRKPVMLAALLGSAAGMLLLSAAATPAMIMLLVFLVQFMGEMYRPASAALIADLVPPQERHSAYALLHTSVNLGFAIGPVVGGFLAERNFAAIFYVNASAAVGFAAMILVVVPETLGLTSASRSETSDPPREEQGGRDPASGWRSPTLWQAVRHVGSNRPFQAFWAATFMAAVVYQQFISTLPLYLRDNGYTPQQYGWIVSTNGALIVLVQLFLAPWVGRFPRGRVLVVSALLTGLGFALHGVAANQWHFMLAVVVWTFGEMLQAPLLGPIAADLAPTAMRARYMGLLAMSWSGAAMIGAPLGGELLRGWGGAALWSACGFTGVVSAAMYAGIAHRIASPGVPRRGE